MPNQKEIVRGRYEINREIARGGMGIVFLAKDLLSNADVALKTSTCKSEKHLIAAFEREAKLLARLNHPHLPKVIDYFLLDNNQQALVMDFISGETLFDLLESNKDHSNHDFEYHQGCAIAPHKVIDWGIQILDILIYLHNFNPPILHRDIKPHNLKLNPVGKVMLLDFGLAKGSMTSLAGNSMPYSPIEQINRAGTDPRSDIYALGSTLHHLLTNQIPLGALERLNYILKKQTISESKLSKIYSSNDDPQLPVAQINPLVSPQLSDHIEKSMALSAENRFQSAAEMKLALISAKQELTDSDFDLSLNFNNSAHSGFENDLLDKSEEKFSHLNLASSLLDSSINFEKTPKLNLASELSDSHIDSNINQINLESELNNSHIEVSQSHPLSKESSELVLSSLGSTPQQSVNYTENFSLPSEIPNTQPSYINSFSAPNLSNYSLNSSVATSEIQVGKKSNKKLWFLVYGLIGLVLPLILGISLFTLIFHREPENIIVSSEPLTSPTLIPDKLKPIEVSTYRLDKNSHESAIDENYQFAVKEEFRFGLKAPFTGFLYVISKDINSAVLIIPNEDKQAKAIKADLETRIPSTNSFSFGQTAPPTAWIYFVVVPSRENNIAKKIEATLNSTDQSLSVPKVGDLIKELDQIAETTNTNQDNKTDSNNKVQVNITKLLKK